MEDTKSDAKATPEAKEAAKPGMKLKLQTKFNEEEYDRWSQTLKDRGKSK